ncbi:MAG: endonuclease III [Kiritimatiellae bacterium]|nr:endonuclease III [Kiritimatiellia bacterium]
MKFKDIPVVDKELEKLYNKNKAPIVDLVTNQTNDPFKILVATILSARTKDQTTAFVVSKLFKKVNKYEDFRKLTVEEIEELIFPAGFYHTKAKHLKKLPDALDEIFDGRIPDTVEELCELPGVGRKTANLVVTLGFKKPAICVDVHVHRICNRLGLMKTKNPLETEMMLRKKLPIEYWEVWNSHLVSFGQTLCKPINPMCNTCPIHAYCNRVNVKTRLSLDPSKEKF